MKNLVSLVAAGLFKVLIVESLNHGIFVGLSERKVFVVLVESCSSESLEVYEVTNRSRLYGLTAAVYTTAGTSHDFDEGVILFTGLNHIENLLCVVEAGCNSNLNLEAVEVEFSVLDTVCSTNSFEFNLFSSLACNTNN